MRNYWLLPLCLLAIIWTAGCDGDDNDSAASEETAAQQPQSVPVRVTTLTEMTLPQTGTYPGTFEAWERAQVLGQTGQRIERIHVREGDVVRRGQAVAQMDDINLQQADVELRTLTREKARLERLVELGAVARQQLEQVETQLEVVERNMEMLRQSIYLTAPIGGVVTGRFFVPGEYFVPGAQAPALLVIEQLDPLKVIINVAERHFPVVKAGMAATIRTEAYGARAFTGQVDRVNPTISPDSRTFRVEIRIDNPDGELSPGMSAQVELALGELTGRFMPRSAMQSEPGRNEPFVYVVEDNRARRTFFTPAERVDGYQRVVEGIADDARVVIEGMGRLNDGSLVHIVDDPS